MKRFLARRLVAVYLAAGAVAVVVTAIAQAARG